MDTGCFHILAIVNSAAVSTGGHESFRNRVYLYNGILFSHKKEWNNAICSNMGGPGDYLLLSEISQRKTNTIRYDLCVESKKKI